jgi:hypothetical protein
MPLCPALEGLQTTCPCVLLSRAFKRLLNHWGSTSFVFSYWIHVLVGDIFLILMTQNLTILKTTWVALPMLISQLTLLEPFSYFTYGVINVPLLLRIIFFPLCPSSTVLGPPLLRLAL